MGQKRLVIRCRSRVTETDLDDPRAGGRDDSAAHGTADYGTLEHEPTGFVRHRRTNSHLLHRRIEATDRPKANATQGRLQWRDTAP